MSTTSSPLSYTIEPHNCALTKIVFKERLDNHLLCKFLHSDNILQLTPWENNQGEPFFYDNERLQMEAVFRKLHKIHDNTPITKELISDKFHNTSQIHTLHVQYVFKKKRPIGRVYPKGSLGLCQFRRALRHTMCRGQYLDIDMVNAHPNILNEAFHHQYPILDDYCKNRDKYLDKVRDHFKQLLDITLTRDHCKNYFIMCFLYGGSYKSWLLKSNCLKPHETDLDNYDLAKLFPPPGFHGSLAKEMRDIGNKIVAANPELTEEIRQEKGYNIEGSVVSWFCQEYESRLLESIYNTLVSLKACHKDDVVLCFDGLMVLLSDKLDTDEKQYSILRKCELAMFEQVGMKISLKVKEFDEILAPDLLDFDIPIFQAPTMTPPTKRYIVDDNQAGEILYEELKDSLIPSNGQLFYKRDHIWTNDENFIQDTLLNYILNSNLYKKTDTGLDKPYSQFVKNAKNIREALLVKIKTQNVQENFEDKFHDTTKGRLCFEDGVLDFKAKKFFIWDNIDFPYYSTVMIKRKFKDYFLNPNRALMEEIKEKIYRNLYGESRLKAALNFLSRALAGHSEDKNFSTYVGKRNCGKGVQYDNLKYAFGDYVSTFELSNILYNNTSKASPEASRMLYWLLDLQFVRLAITQETPPEMVQTEHGSKHKKPSSNFVVNGKLIKKIAGGGDTHTARRNYDRKDTYFKLDTTLQLMGNTRLEFDIPDVMEQCLEFYSVNQFKSRDEIEQMRREGENEMILSSFKVRDDTIKDMCKTEEWMNATVYLMYENYIDHAVPILRDEDDRQEVISPIRRKILALFEVTKNLDDCTPVKEVTNLIQENPKMVQAELESMGVIKKKNTSRGEYRNQWCYYGLLPTPELEEEPETE